MKKIYFFQQVRKVLSSLRVLFTLVALFATMSINAQIVKVYENGTLKSTLINTPSTKYEVEFEEYESTLLKGEFSISPTKRVLFTKGNLQATYHSAENKYTWGIAANQYDYVGNTAGNTTIGSQTDGAVVDLFGWSTKATYYGISTSENDRIYTGDFKDWGNLLESYGKKYHTLSVDEWTYLLNTFNATSGARTQAKRFAKANVKSTDGLLIFPDGYDGITTGIDDSYINNSNPCPFSPISDDTWQTMESAGVVFLPLAGYRLGSNVKDAGARGTYWMSNGAGSMSYCAVINSYEVLDRNCQAPSSDGLSVRLVLVVKE